MSLYKFLRECVRVYHLTEADVLLLITVIKEFQRDEKTDCA